MIPAIESSKTSQHPRDFRLLAILGVVVGVALLGLVVQKLPSRGVVAERAQIQPIVQPSTFSSLDGNKIEHPKEQQPIKQEDRIDPSADPDGHLKQAIKREISERFQQATLMLHAKRYDEAMVALQRVLKLNPYQVDALVNMGFALVDQQAYELAYDYFERAMDLNPAQANAYYGAALVQEGLGNLEGAMGGMRAFLHLSQDKDPEQIHIVRARSALWEWESKLGRGPWGPTKGIPPGFSAEELKRDGKGVAIKMPLTETITPDGAMKYEIKSADKFQLFKP